MEIHAFTVGLSTRVQCKFLIGKIKVAPIKQLSVPKLELEAATIGARLLSFASKELHLNRTAVLHVWTDSQVVVDWIKSTKQRKTLVANRLIEISTMDHQLHWHHIPTTLNPADHGTRGLEPREINRNVLHLQPS